MRKIILMSFAAICVTIGCGGEDETSGSENENEVITTVSLTFSPIGGGDPVISEFNDADGDGGQAPTIDTVILVAGTQYALTIGFENRLETPAEDITEEISAESDEHQIFVLGSGVFGPASNVEGAAIVHDYADEDDNGLPIGLENTVMAQAGTGDLTVMLRHIPSVNGVAQKEANLAELLASEGQDELPGSTDALVTFPIANDG